MKSYMKVSEALPGVKVIVDGGFTCIPEGTIVELKEDTDGSIYFDCSAGHHDIAGQVEDNHLIGMFLAD